MLFLCLIILGIWIIRPSSISFKKADGTYFDYQIGVINEQGIPVLDKKFNEYPELYSKYFLNLDGPIDSNFRIHCLHGFLDITSNSNTIWYKIHPIYYLNYSTANISIKGDTLNSTKQISVKVDNGKMYIKVLLNSSLKKYLFIPICDKKVFKSCGI